MKRFMMVVALLIAVIPMAFLMTACGNNNDNGYPNGEETNAITFSRFAELIEDNKIHSVVQQGHNFFVLTRADATQQVIDVFMSDPVENATYIHYNENFVLVTSLIEAQVLSALTGYQIAFFIVPVEVRQGVVAVLDIEGTPTTTQINSSISRLQTMLAQRGFVEANVMRQGASQIRVEVPGLSNVDELMAVIGEQATIEFRTSPDGVAFLSGKQITSVSTVKVSDSAWAVRIHFTNEGGELFRQAVQDVGLYGQIYIFVNGNLISAPVIGGTDVGLDNTATINSPEFTTLVIVEQLRNQLEMGLLDVQFTMSETFTAEYALRPDGSWGWTS